MEQLIPRYLSVSVTWRCNHRCPGCFHGQKEFKPVLDMMPDIMPFPDFKRIVDELREHKPKLGIYSDGDNFFHPNIYDMIEYAQANSMPVEMDTSGAVLDPERLAATNVTDIIVSIDGFSQETYSAYRRNGNFRNVLNRLTKLAREVERQGANTNIIVKYLVNSYTEDEIEEAARYYADLPNVTFKLDFFHPPIPAKDFINSRAHCPIENYEHWRAKKREEYNIWQPSDDPKLAELKVLSLPRIDHCINVERGLFIETDGSLLPCRPACDQYFFFGKTKSYFGNVFTDGGVMAVFNGEKARAYRANFKKHGGNYSICGKCERLRSSSHRDMAAAAVKNDSYENMASGIKRPDTATK